MHKMRDGKEIEISAMSDTHLIHTCRMFQWKAISGITVASGGGYNTDDIYYDEDHLIGQEALDAMSYNEYEKELLKRGLSI